VSTFHLAREYPYVMSARKAAWGVRMAQGQLD